MNEQPLPPGIVQFPRSYEGSCAECGGPTNIYETDLSVDERTGQLICGNCNRARLRHQGPNKRPIRRQHKWKPGHAPDGDDTPESPYIHLNLQPTEMTVVNQKAELGGGPESIIPCFDCGVKMRLVAEAGVEQLLAPLGYKPAEGTAAPKEKVLILICPKCERVVQFRESIYKREVARHG